MEKIKFDKKTLVEIVRKVENDPKIRQEIEEFRRKHGTPSPKALTKIFII